MQALLREFPRHHILMAGAVAFLLLGMSLYPSNDAEAKRQVVEKIPITVHDEIVRTELSTEDIANEPVQTNPPQEQPALTWKEQKVAKGDNLSTIFQRASLRARDVYEIASSKGGKSLRNLYPGETLRFGLNSEGELQQLQRVRSLLERDIFIRESHGFSFDQEKRQAEKLMAYREGIIQDSLFLSAKRADLPDNIIMELANIFGWDVDFVFDIRQGDSFSLLYEEKFLEGEKIGTGNILAATFINQGETFQAVRYENSRGITSYYTPEGMSMRKAFLRAPLDVFRISSGFNLQRKHPIHKKIKAHRGVDYAAPRGTPVYAAGDGKVIAAGYTKANGNYIFIQHGQKYTTKYLHLTKKSVRKGQSVRQRQVIGTVGSTGYATGPHLHYEFLVNGVHRNPRTVSLPKALPIPASEKLAFQEATRPVLMKLAHNQQASQLASSEKKSNTFFN